MDKDLEEGLAKMNQGVAKLIDILEGRDKTSFTSVEYISFYTIVYDMCAAKPPRDHSAKLYDYFREVMVKYLNESVGPSLGDKHGEFMLREIDWRWTNHRLMVRWLSRFFHYLDRFFTARRSLPKLNAVGLTCFRDMVNEVMMGKVADFVIDLIEKEREGRDELAVPLGMSEPAALHTESGEILVLQAVAFSIEHDRR